MSSGFSERKKIIMTVFRVEEEVVLVKVFFQSKRGVRKMKPWFCDEDEGRIFILEDLQKIESITREPFYIPSQVLYVFTTSGIRSF